MKKLIAMLGAVVAAVTSAFAATPVAVWDRDFNVTTKGPITLDVQGNTVAEDGSTVTIKDGATVGVRFKWSTGRDGYTVIAKVRTIKSSESNIQALVCGGNGGNRTGVTLQTNGNTKGIWDNGNWYNASYVQKQGALTLVEDSDTNYIAARHKSSNNGLCGTYLFQNSGSGWASVYEANGCRSVNDASAYKDVALGGPVTASNNFKGAAGMVIEKVAIFHAHLTAEEIAAFEFVDPISVYTRWSANPAVLTWAKSASGAQNFHEGPWKLFNIETGADGDQVTGSNIPGQTANITPWHVFSTTSGYKYVAPGYVLRLASNYPGVNLNAAFTDLTFGGLIVEPYAGGYTFNSDGTRQTALGDNRTENGVETWYEIHEDLTFSRQGTFTLFGTLNFDIAKGKTLDLNSARTGQTLTLDAATHGCIKLHGAGKLKVHNLNASGAVTLDYTDVDLTREDAYVTGTITVGAATTIKLPAGVKIGDSIKLATTISGVVDSAKVLIDGVADDSIEWMISNGSLVAIEATDTVKIGDTNYVSLRKALEVATDGTVIELLKDIASRDETIPAGITIELAGHSISGVLDIKAGALITDGGVAKIDGIATSFDATFNDPQNPTAFKFKEEAGVTLQYDTVDGRGTPLFVNEDPISKDTGITLKNHPYFNYIPAAWFNNTTELTLAVVGTMTEATRTTFIHMGKTTDNGYGLLLATGDKKDEVIVAWNHGTTVTVITRMQVPNAAASRHVYVVTKKDDIATNKTTFTVYLDNIKWKTLVVDKFTIVGGVQVGSDFGGQLYQHATGDNIYHNVTADVGLINAIRLYDRVISPAEIAQYSAEAEYPYVSPNGSSARTVAGETDWIATTEVWSNTPAGATEAVAATAPLAGDIDLTASEAATITVNVAEDATCEMLTLKGSAMTFVAGEGGSLAPSAATIGVPVTVKPGSLDLSKANITIVGDGKIVADYATMDIASILTTTTVYVTGEIEEQEDGVVTLVKPTAAGRTVSDLAYDETTSQYGFTVTPDMVNVTVTPVENMTATVAAGSVACTITEGVAAVPYGATITVTYAPAAGYHTTEGAVTTVTIENVTEEQSVDTTTVTPVEINMYTVKVMQVANAIATVTIGEGTPTVVTADTVQVPHGSAFRVDYAAAEGYELVAIEGDAAGLVTENYHYDRVTQNMGDYTLHFEVAVAKSATELFLEAITAGESSIALTGDVTVPSVVVISGATTIDLAGHKLTATAYGNNYLIVVNNGAKLTITDSAEGGVIEYLPYTNFGKTSSMIKVLGELVVEGGTLKSDYSVVKVDEDPGKGKFTLNGGTLEVVGSYEGLTYTAMVWGDAILNAGTIKGKVQVLAHEGNNVSKFGTVTVNGGSYDPDFITLITHNAEYFPIAKIASSITDLTVVPGTAKGYLAVADIEVVDGTAEEGYVVKTLAIKSADLPGAEEVPADQKDAYNAWAAANGITAQTGTEAATTAATAFVMGVTVGEDQTLVKAAEDKANEILKEVTTAEDVDLAALLEQAKNAGADGLVVTTKNTNLTVKLVPATLGQGVETSAKLFKLSITINK